MTVFIMNGHFLFRVVCKPFIILKLKLKMFRSNRTPYLEKKSIVPSVILRNNNLQLLRYSDPFFTMFEEEEI